MSFKDWKNKEIGQNLTERWGFKMDLSKLNEKKKNPVPKQLEPFVKEKQKDADKDEDSKEDSEENENSEESNDSEELEVEDGPGKGKKNMGITKDGKMVKNPMEESSTVAGVQGSVGKRRRK